MSGRCAAQLRNSALRYGKVRYCQRMPVPGKQRCRLHGGLTPRGIASPHFKTGEHVRDRRFDYAAVLGHSRLGELYAHARAADDPLSTKQQIAIYEARIAQALERISSSGDVIPQAAVSSWAEVQQARQTMSAARTDQARAQAGAKLAAALNAHDVAMTPEARVQGAHADMDRAHAVLDRLKRTERELQETRLQAFTAEAAFGLMAKLSVLVKESIDAHVTDADGRRAILRDLTAGLARLTARRPDPATRTA
jgi:hypothetical protein